MGGAWVAQLVKRLTSAQVMILGLMIQAVLTAQSLEPASDSVSPLCSSPARALSLSLSKIKINIKKVFKKEGTCWDEHWVLYLRDESLNSVPEIIITLNVN